VRNTEAITASVLYNNRVKHKQPHVRLFAFEKKLRLHLARWEAFIVADTNSLPVLKMSTPSSPGDLYCCGHAVKRMATLVCNRRYVCDGCLNNGLVKELTAFCFYFALLAPR